MPSQPPCPIMLSDRAKSQNVLWQVTEPSEWERGMQLGNGPIGVSFELN